MNDEPLLQIEREVLGWEEVCRTTASYRIQSAEDVAGVLDLFRMNYARARERAERNFARR